MVQKPSTLKPGEVHSGTPGGDGEDQTSSSTTGGTDTLQYSAGGPHSPETFTAELQAERTHTHTHTAVLVELKRRGRERVKSICRFVCPGLTLGVRESLGN